MYLLYKLPFYQSLNYFRALYYYITYTLNQIKSRICLWTLKRDQVWPRCALFARRQFRPQRPNYSIKTMEQLKLSATIIVIVQLLLNRLDFVGRFLVFRTSDFGTGVLRCIRDTLCFSGSVLDELLGAELQEGFPSYSLEDLSQYTGYLPMNFNSVQFRWKLNIEYGVNLWNMTCLTNLYLGMN